jgi:hypothetical protein
MSDFPALPTLAEAAPGRSRRARRWLVAGAVALAIAAGAGVWVFQANREQQHQAELTRAAEIATARARVVAAARARGIAVTAKAVAATQAADKAASAAVPTSARVADASKAGAIFSTHSWYVAPPPPAYVAPPPPPPPPPPTAPPLPFVFLGSYTPSGDATVFFMTRGDRVYDIKVGDTVDGIYLVESAKGGQLTFLYKPLNQRQTLATGANP